MQPTARLFPTSPSNFQKSSSTTSYTTLFATTTQVPTTITTKSTITSTTFAPTPKPTEQYIEKISTTTLSPTTKQHTLSPAIIPKGRSESFILKKLENSVHKKILLLDLQFQRKLLNFILSPSDKKKKLSQLDIKDFLQN